MILEGTLLCPDNLGVYDGRVMYVELFCVT